MRPCCWNPLTNLDTPQLLTLNIPDKRPYTLRPCLILGGGRVFHIREGDSKVCHVLACVGRAQMYLVALRLLRETNWQCTSCSRLNPQCPQVLKPRRQVHDMMDWKEKHHVALVMRLHTFEASNNLREGLLQDDKGRY